MKLSKMKKEELEILSHADLTELILEEAGKSLNTAIVFKKICDLLGYSDNDFTDKIGDFYTSLTLDKRFAFLANNEWDLREKHAIELTIDEDEHEDEIEEELEEEVEEELIDEDKMDDDIPDDVVEDLSILTEDELEEEV